MSQKSSPSSRKTNPAMSAAILPYVCPTCTISAHQEIFQEKAKVDILSAGLYQRKYKIFCQSISTAQDAKYKDNSIFSSPKKPEIFLLVEKNDDAHFRLSSSLNTGVIKEARECIFKQTLVIEPNRCYPNQKSQTDFPRYFKIEDTGDIVEIPENLLITFLEI